MNWRKAKPKKTSKRKTLETMGYKDLVKVLDREFSLYVRLNAANNSGLVSCATCGKTFFWNDGANMTLGHYISRTHHSVRWHETNTAPQCRSCNSFKGGEQYKMRMYLKHKYGNDAVEKTEQWADITKTETAETLRIKVIKYRALVKTLKNEKVYKEIKMGKTKTKVVQNHTPDFDDLIQPAIDNRIMKTVHEIFESVIALNPLDDLFKDLSERLIDDLKANSLLEFNLELTADQKEQLQKAVKAKGHETVRNYEANLTTDKRTKTAYGLVREKTTEIVDAVLSAIGQEINRGAVINARAVQANSKNEKYDEILLRKTKSSGDITVPTSVIVLSTNCVDVIKASCQEVLKEPEDSEAEETAAEDEDI